MTPFIILGRLRLMTELDDDAARTALPHCQAAMDELLAGLKPRCNRNDPRLAQAGAAIALCMLLMQEDNNQNEDGISSFKAGDITVTKKDSRQGRLAAAERLRGEALEDIRELLRDTGFYARSAQMKNPTKRGGGHA